MNVALPALQANLGSTDYRHPAGGRSIRPAAGCVGFLVGSSLGDLYGRRRIFLIGVNIFAIASIACGSTLQHSRADSGASRLQGLGAAFLVPGSLAIISATFEREKLADARHQHLVRLHRHHYRRRPVLGGWLIEGMPPGAGLFLSTCLSRRPSSRCRLWRVPQTRSLRPRKESIGPARWRRPSAWADWHTDSLNRPAWAGAPPRLRLGSLATRKHRVARFLCDPVPRCISHVAAAAVCFPQFHRRQSAHALSLRGVGNFFLSLSARPDRRSSITRPPPLAPQRYRLFC